MYGLLPLRTVVAVSAAVFLLASACPASAFVEPVCDTGGPYKGEAYHETVLDASGSYDPDGEIIVYFWDFGDDSTGYGETVTHTYYNEGTFMVTLCLTDDGENIVCCETTTTVHPRAPIEIQAWGSIKARYR